MKFDLRPYELFLFDVDGTIAETEGLGHLPAFNAAFEKHAIPWRWDAQVYRELLEITGGFEHLHDWTNLWPIRNLIGDDLLVIQV